jgi:hypothetical protein
MRIWSLHPKYLDSKGLVALWRESLLAQKVLRGETKGYKNHPQLDRFKQQIEPIASIATYLVEIETEAFRRGYRFDASKIDCRRTVDMMPVTIGQLHYEWQFLKQKLACRDPQKLSEIVLILDPEPHPLLRIIEGPIESWEKLKYA